VGSPAVVFARKVMDGNNSHAIFSNVGDSLDGLRSAISDRFSDASVEVVGCVRIVWSLDLRGSEIGW
jgi:hypothetical protein